jgi:S1-C subfamily serine protease
MPMPTEPVDGALPSETAASPGAGSPAATAAGTDPIDRPVDRPVDRGAPVALVREVQGPSNERGRVAGLAMVCSAAGVALGFALAGSLFAAMAPPPTRVGPVGYGCPGHRGGHGDVAYHGRHQAPRPWLGITVTVASRRSPAVLTGVVSGAPAYEAGLRLGDRITRLDGESIDSASELIHVIQRHQPGDRVALEAIGRDGHPIAIPSLRLAAMPIAAP